MSYPDDVKRYIELVREAEAAVQKASLFGWRELDDWELETLSDHLLTEAWSIIQRQLDDIDRITAERG